MERQKTITHKEAKGRLKELSKAGNRLGVAEYQITEWLLGFAQINLVQLSHGEWLNLAYEVHALVCWQGKHSKTDAQTLAGCRWGWEGLQGYFILRCNVLNNKK